MKVLSLMIVVGLAAIGLVMAIDHDHDKEQKKCIRKFPCNPDLKEPICAHKYNPFLPVIKECLTEDNLFCFYQSRCLARLEAHEMIFCHYGECDPDLPCARRCGPPRVKAMA